MKNRYTITLLFTILLLLFNTKSYAKYIDHKEIEATNIVVEKLEGVFGKLYDTDEDGIEDIFILNNTPDFDYEGTLINDFGNINNNKYQPYSDNKRPIWDKQLYNVRKIIVLNPIKPIETIRLWFRNAEKVTSINNLDKIDTSNVSEIYGMFAYCRQIKTIDLSNFETDHVTNMSDLFYECNNLEEANITNFVTSKVTTMKAMFAECSKLKNINVSNFDTKNVTDMGMMFKGCSNLAQIQITNFNTSNVIQMNSMFCWCNNLKEINVTNFNTSKVTTMKDMFSNCKSLKSIDLSTFSTKNVENMYGMFFTCSNLKTIYIGNQWNTNKVTQSNIMFSNDTSLVGGKGTTYTNSKIDKEYARNDEGKSKPGYMTNKTAKSINIVNTIDRLDNNMTEQNDIVNEIKNDITIESENNIFIQDESNEDNNGFNTINDIKKEIDTDLNNDVLNNTNEKQIDFNLTEEG